MAIRCGGKTVSVGSAGDGSGARPVKYGRKLELTVDEQRSLIPQTERYRPARKSRLWLALFVIVVVAVAAFAGYTYFLQGGGSSPEDAFRGFVAAVNAGDAREAVDFTVDKFASDSAKEAGVQELLDDWAQDGMMMITIHSIEIVHRSDMGTLVRTQLDDLVSQVESLYGVNVKDSCGLIFNTTTIQGGETNSGEGNIPLVKIGGSWYLAPIMSV